ncbi:MAG: AraC family transcriptional regulator [Bacillota bacterium]|nr:AraC family transcriptional regulator [Bacillota bacterium]
MKLTSNPLEQLVFDSGYYINVNLSENDVSFSPHWHRETEVILCLQGECCVNLNGTSYSINTGDILFISPGNLHSLSAPDHSERMILQFDYSLINNLKDFNLFSAVLQFITIISSKLDPDIHTDIYNLMLDIRSEYFGDNEFKNAVMYVKLLSIYILIAKKYTKATSHLKKIPQNKYQDYMNKFSYIFNYIEEHYAENLTLEQLAGLGGFSRFHFSRLFKKFTNMSLTEYINCKRISKAEVLLLNPSLSITEVALQSGFNSLSSFNRVFRAHKNCSPKEFKKLRYTSDPLQDTDVRTTL